MSKERDLIGMVFGRLTVLSKVNGDKSPFLCQCSCGKKLVVIRNSLITGNTKSCGCLKRRPQCIDLTGQTFGRLTVIDRAPIDKKRRKARWVCQCECGNVLITVGTYLRRGSRGQKSCTQSCGCLRNERATGTIQKVNVWHRGPNHYNWVDGDHHLSDEDKLQARLSPEARKFTREILKRDGYRCAHCGEIASPPRVHHLMSFTRFPDIRYDHKNAITLCRGCHDEFHRLYGTKRFTDKDFRLWNDKQNGTTGTRKEK
jgi:hypothetical protein